MTTPSPVIDRPSQGNAPYPGLADLSACWTLLVGSSAGLGQAFARELAERNAKVVMVDAGPRLVRPPVRPGIDQRCIALDPHQLGSAGRCRVLLGQLGIRIGLLVLCDGQAIPPQASVWDHQHRIAALLSWCGAFRSSLMRRPRGAVIVASDPDAPAGSPDAAFQAARRRIALDLHRTWSIDRLHVQSLLAAPGAGDPDSLAAASLERLPEGDREVTADTPVAPRGAGEREEDEDLVLLRLIFANDPPRRRRTLTRAG